MENMLMQNPFLKQRNDFSADRLRQLIERVSAAEILPKDAKFCIYACGSYARLEAAPTSDLDLFFVDYDLKPDSTNELSMNQRGQITLPREIRVSLGLHGGDQLLVQALGGQINIRQKSSLGRIKLTPDSTQGTTKIDQTLMTAKLIEISRSLDFPEFSNDGQYLQTHSLSLMLEDMGGPSDDIQNFFTARMLLLLESRPISGQPVYFSALNEIVNSYYRDYHDHEKRFRPVFLLNDILRFWRTLCLNYEHRRNRRADNDDQKSKHHVRNLKLKFSRLLTCFSMVIPLAKNQHTPPEDVIALVPMTPFDRLITAADTPKSRDLVRQLVERYVWFLEEVASKEVADKMKDRKYRDDVFERGREFSHQLYELLQECVRDPVSLRYIVM